MFKLYYIPLNKPSIQIATILYVRLRTIQISKPCPIHKFTVNNIFNQQFYNSNFLIQTNVFLAIG